MERQQSQAPTETAIERARTSKRISHAANDGQTKCGQAIPADLFEAKRDEQLFDVVTEGKSLAAEIAELKVELDATDGELESLRVRLRDLELQAASAKKCAERIASLKLEIASLEEKLFKVKSVQAVGVRIKELASQERTLNEQLAELEGKQLRAEKYQHERLQGFEARVNDWFEHMRRTAHSKKHVEMPLMLDDAESYTTNSFVDLPNQKFYFRVTESDLAIEIMEVRRAA